MKKSEQAGPGANHDPGMSSQTASNVLYRTAKNTPVNESRIRGTPLRIFPEVRAILEQIHGPEKVRGYLAAGIIEVI